MPLDLAVRVDGIAELVRALRVAPPEMRKQLGVEMREIARPIALTANLRAPGPSPADHGLGGSYTVRSISGGARVGSPKAHAPIIEFGEQALVKGAGRQRAHRRELRKQPTLIPAIAMHAPATRRKVETAMERTLSAMLRAQHVQEA